jgi:hypothetical protein
MALKTHKKIGIYPQVEYYHELLSTLKGLGTVALKAVFRSFFAFQK